MIAMIALGTKLGLKPDNLFITKDDRLEVLDFGIAKFIEPVGEGLAQTDIATRKVQTDPGWGTVGYMSPEQVRGKHSIIAPTSFRLAPCFMKCCQDNVLFIASRPSRHTTRSQSRR